MKEYCPSQAREGHCTQLQNMTQHIFQTFSDPSRLKASEFTAQTAMHLSLRCQIVTTNAPLILFLAHKQKKQQQSYLQKSFHRRSLGAAFQVRRVFFSLELSADALRLRDGVPGASSEGASVRWYSSIGGVGSCCRRMKHTFNIYSTE